MMKRKFVFAALTLGSIGAFTSCKKNNNDVTPPVIPAYTVPATYSFDSVDYTEASGRISMWVGFTGYLGRSTTRQLTQDSANNLWTNVNNSFTAETSSNLPFSVSQINAFTFNIAEKTADASLMKQYTDSQVNVSQYYSAVASQGTPGKVGTRLGNYTGLEFNQLVAKGLMGALQLSRIYEYLDKTTSDDNTTLTASGTAMQHDWDLAFGYVGIPTTYDSSLAYASTEPNRPLALGGYFRERARYIQTGGMTFEAFRIGRAAIGVKDYTRRDSAITAIKTNLEKTLAASAYAYFTLPQGSSDLATKFHALSEAYGFCLALKYRPANSPLTAVNYQTLMSIVQTNFYDLAADATNAKLIQAQGILTNAYGQLQP